MRGCDVFADAWAATSRRLDRWRWYEPSSALHRPGQVTSVQEIPTACAMHSYVGITICQLHARQHACPEMRVHIPERPASSNSSCLLTQGPRFIALTDVPVALASCPPVPVAVTEDTPDSTAGGAELDVDGEALEDRDDALLPPVHRTLSCQAQPSAVPTAGIAFALCDYHVVYHPSYRVPVLCLLPRHEGALRKKAGLPLDKRMACLLLCIIVYAVSNDASRSRCRVLRVFKMPLPQVQTTTVVADFECFVDEHGTCAPHPFQTASVPLSSLNQTLHGSSD